MDLGNPLWFLEPKAPPIRSKIINRNDYNSNATPAQLPQQQRPAQQQPSPQQLQRQVQSQSQVPAQRPNTVSTSSIGTRRPQTPAVPRFQPIAVAPQTRLNTPPVPLQKPEPICQIKNSVNSANTQKEQHGSVRVPRVSVAQSSLTLGESFNDTGSLSSRDDRNASDSDDGGCDVASVLSKASTKASSSRRSIKSGRCDKRERRRQQQQQRAESRCNRREKREIECLGRGGGSVVRHSDGGSDQECTASETVTSPENSSGNVNGTVAGAGTSTSRICRRRRFNKLTTYLPTLSLGLSTAIILFSDRRSVASVLMAALHATRSIPYLF